MVFRPRLPRPPKNHLAPKNHFGIPSVCLVDYRTRMRAVHHLWHRADATNRCRTAVLSRVVPPLSAEAAAAADESDRLHQRRCRRSGVNPLEAAGSYSMLRISVSGREIGPSGRILAGLLPVKDRNRPSGRPSAGRRGGLGGLPGGVRAKGGPGGRFSGREGWWVN